MVDIFYTSFLSPIFTPRRLWVIRVRPDRGSVKPARMYPYGIAGH